MTDLVSLREPSAPTGVPAGEASAMRAISLNAYFGATHAVRDVNLDVPTHEVTAIIGPSGCGKSTLLRCLNRMHETIPLARVSGDVEILGSSIYGEGTNATA